MIITRTSEYSGITRTMDLNITHEQITNYNSGMLIQDAFSNLSEDEREFYLTGITAEEWDKLFPDEDDGEIIDPIDPNTGLRLEDTF